MSLRNVFIFPGSGLIDIYDFFSYVDLLFDVDFGKKYEKILGGHLHGFLDISKKGVRTLPISMTLGGHF